MKKYVYLFLPKSAEGSNQMTDILGGKGANLAEMCNLSIPVPPGFTISTEVCTYYMKYNKYPPGLKLQINEALQKIENSIGKKFGDVNNPLLLSVRSGARQSMPGMMETVLNIGLTSQTIPGLIKKTNKPRFVYDSYRRLLMMYADVVMETTFEYQNIRLKMESLLNRTKQKYKYSNDHQLNDSQLIKLCNDFEELIFKNFNVLFPNKPTEQLWGAIQAVLQSWNGKRAIEYRNIENIPHDWGTAVNIQCMVFGNMGNSSATGVAFTRNPSTGENIFFGEWLRNAQGEDVVAGTRTPKPISNNSQYDLQHQMPTMYSQLHTIQRKLESHYNEMQDIEFTIENNQLWLLQTRKGKRNGFASIKIAIDMWKEKKMNQQTMLGKILPKHINEILLPTINYHQKKELKIIATGLPAGPGCATGQIVFDPETAEKFVEKGKPVVLVREETSPEDVQGMFVSNAILTSKGGMTSHAALVARGWGKCCIVGCSELSIDYKNKKLVINKLHIKQGEWITLDGSQGYVYSGKVQLVKPNITKNTLLNDLLKIINRNQKVLVRTNAESNKDAKTALSLGASGIGLCRTEHMFFKPNRISAMREMILSDNKQDRKNAIMKLLPYQKRDFYRILKVMNNRPVTIRLLDPPLHEFLPSKDIQIIELAKNMNVTRKKLKQTIENLAESNPMLGHRGCRLGITYPEITEMQTQAIAQATIQLIKEGFQPNPEIMIPLTGNLGEFINQKNIVQSALSFLFKKHNIKKHNLKIGTMIELPRACLIANQIAEHADFLSFGTNDLTQTTFGFSRDDIGSFLPSYIEQKIIKTDPFQTLDQEGVGELIKMAIQKARSVNPKIKIGICGEHGGDPESIKFLVRAGVDYVSCSPYRVPIAKLTLAQQN